MAHINKGAPAKNRDDPISAQVGQQISVLVATVKELLRNASPAEIEAIRGLLVSGRAAKGKPCEAAVQDCRDESHRKRRRGPVAGSVCFWPAALRERWGISATTLWRWERSGAIPARDFHISNRPVGWLRQTIEDFECAPLVTRDGPRRRVAATARGGDPRHTTDHSGTPGPRPASAAERASDLVAPKPTQCRRPPANPNLGWCPETAAGPVARRLTKGFRPPRG